MKTTFKKAMTAIFATTMCAIAMTGAMTANAAPELSEIAVLQRQKEDEKKWDAIIKRLAASAFKDEYRVIEHIGDDLVLESVFNKAESNFVEIVGFEIKDPCGSVPHKVKMKKRGRRVYVEIGVQKILGTPLDPGYIDPIRDETVIADSFEVVGGKYTLDYVVTNPHITPVTKGTVNTIIKK